MLGGDISNTVAPAVLVVFEGLVGRLPADAVGSHGRDLKFRRWSAAAKRWEIIPYAYSVLWAQTYRIELVTYLPPKLAEQILVRIDNGHLPWADLEITTPTELAQSLAFRPNVACVYDTDPNRWLTYGGKGRIISNLTEINGWR